MATTTAYAYNSGATISGTIQSGHIAKLNDNNIYTKTGVTWYMGADEDPGFIIVSAYEPEKRPQFWRSVDKTDAALLDLLARNFNQSFTNPNDAYTIIPNSLKSVYLPNVTIIGDYVFVACTGLTSINIPKLTTIGFADFALCYSLTEIDLPYVTSVNDLAFYSCKSLISINLPSCINLGTTLGNDAVFAGISGNTIALIIPGYLLTDGDIISLQSNNSVTIYTCEVNFDVYTYACEVNFDVYSCEVNFDVYTYCEVDINPPALIITFDDILHADLVINGISSSVTDWNTFFNLPLSGNPFSSVFILENSVYLFGGSEITLRESLFDNQYGYGSYLISFIDNANCIVAAGYDAFGADNYNGCSGLTSVSLPACTTLIECCTFYNASSLISVNLPSLITCSGSYNFTNCTSLTLINIPSCVHLGSDVGHDFIFDGISGNYIELTVSSLLMTCNTSGTPDEDIQILQNNNTVTITIV